MTESGIEAAPAGVASAAPPDLLLRVLANAVVMVAVMFLVNNYLIFWRDWPGFFALLGHLGFPGVASDGELQGGQLTLAWLQCLTYVGGVAAVALYVLLTPRRGLRADAERLSALAAFVVRFAYWSVLLVGAADMLISFLRVEGFLEAWVGQQLTSDLGRSIYRGTYVHYPLMALSVVIAFFTRSLGFIWLALLVVFAEFQIVISRFVFSYEQAFMGDLVRFWYAALFLFASAYALIDEGHVRVDVLYARFTTRGKAWANATGSLLLGLPLCWVILTTGMWGRGSSINSPLLSFEISQSGFGMYVKYLMAGFLVVFAFSMIVQFAGYFLSSAADLRGEPGGAEPPEPVH